MEQNTNKNEKAQEKKNQVFLLPLSSKYPVSLPSNHHCHYSFMDWPNLVNGILLKFFCQTLLLIVLNHNQAWIWMRYNIRLRDYILLSLPSYISMTAQAQPITQCSYSNLVTEYHGKESSNFLTINKTW